MVERIILIFVCLLLAAIFWFLAVLVDRWDAQKHKLEELKLSYQLLSAQIDILEGKVEAHGELFSGVATAEDIEREANAVLNLRNEVGKLGNRVQAIERKDKQ